MFGMFVCKNIVNSFVFESVLVFLVSSFLWGFVDRGKLVNGIVLFLK